jgi:phage-related protein
MYPGSDEVENILSNAGRVTIVFNCKPQSFLKIGETPVTFPTSGSITNPTLYASEPIIVINGNGAITLTINDKSFSLVNVVDNITLNSELVAAYKGTELQNGNIRFTSFPLLSPGVNNISWTGTVTSVQIIPRWYTI